MRHSTHPHTSLATNIRSFYTNWSKFTLNEDNSSTNVSSSWLSLFFCSRVRIIHTYASIACRCEAGKSMWHNWSLPSRSETSNHPLSAVPDPIAVLTGSFWSARRNLQNAQSDLIQMSARMQYLLQIVWCFVKTPCSTKIAFTFLKDACLDFIQIFVSNTEMRVSMFKNAFCYLKVHAENTK